MTLGEIRALLLQLRYWGRLKIGSKFRIDGGIINPNRGKIRIGRKAEIKRGAIIDANDGFVTIGDHFSLNPYSILYGSGGLTIGNWVRIAAHVVVIPANHGFSDPDTPIKKQPETRLGIVIEDDVWIGAGAVVLDGAHISRGCVIGAGSVVRGRTDPLGIYVGAPARKVGVRGEKKRPAGPGGTTADPALLLSRNKD
ncbi:acyltransferase [Sinorhizobium mexicanum]|uniref:Acyltransferase n=1 Tax=Sinorhizobium mexicanum TaxID=375549 RepID=A0A859QFF3_9HYPH|nr:acyltransferase [Sinorhizobium mexicanum]MBP1887698.1 acetyltransferase-like isoleucine patch superfamily enzyme [Sinorhizobium mexicanum]QLL62284.1 acyltransferase [Sinorhizobium mexicanum]